MSIRNQLSVEDGAASGDDFVVLKDGTRLFRENEIGPWFQDLSAWRPLLKNGELKDHRDAELQAGLKRAAEAEVTLIERHRRCTSQASTTRESKRSSAASTLERLFVSSSYGRKKG